MDRKDHGAAERLERRAIERPEPGEVAPARPALGHHRSSAALERGDQRAAGGKGRRHGSPAHERRLEGVAGAGVEHARVGTQQGVQPLAGQAEELLGSLARRQLLQEIRDAALDGVAA